MQPLAIADELRRVGAIEEVDGKLRMTTRGYVPSSDPESAIDILGLDTAELMETIDQNMRAGAGDKLFQLKVLSDLVPVKYVAEFNAYSRRLVRPVFEELDRWLAERDLKQDCPGTDERAVVGLGIYQINRAAQRSAATEPDEGESVS